MRGGRDGYRDQIVTCDVDVSLNSKTHPPFMKSAMAQAHTELVSCAFSVIPICPFLIQRIFHLLVYLQMHTYIANAIVIVSLQVKVSCYSHSVHLRNSANIIVF